MKIMLLGEFSGFYKNLSDGLRHLNHQVTVAATGDGWKKIPSDIQLPICGNSLLEKVVYRFRLMKFFLSLKDYDVVQFVSPFVIPVNFFPSKFVLKRIKDNNKSIFLSAAGSDSFFWKYGRKNLKYGPFDDYLKYDLKREVDPYDTDKYRNYNEWFVENINGVIPVMYEYEVSYEHLQNNLIKTIPLPINLEAVQYQENFINNRIVIFHGLNRPGFKGTHYVEEAFKILSEKYPRKFEFIIEGRLPLDKYLLIMEKTNIVIDQVNSYSLGLNGLYALAMGKIVLGGCEPESLISQRVDRSPVINIKPNVDDIVSKIEGLVADNTCFLALGRDSRNYVERVHCCKIIAGQYVSEWSKYIK